MTRTEAPAMSQEERKKLREAAEKATPGPWGMCSKFEIGPISTADDQSFGMVLGVADVFGERKKENGAFIALANSTTILALLDALDAAEARVAGAVEAERERWMRVFEYACTIPADNRRGVWVQAFIEDKTWAVTDFHKWSATAIRSTP